MKTPLGYLGTRVLLGSAERASSLDKVPPIYLESVTLQAGAAECASSEDEVPPILLHISALQIGAPTARGDLSPDHINGLAHQCNAQSPNTFATGGSISAARVLEWPKPLEIKSSGRQG